MTPTYFINTESLTFSQGEIVIVSGKDLAKIYILLLSARDAIRTSGKQCIDPIDTRTLVKYQSDITERCVSFEYLALQNENTNVVLVGNQFDKENLRQNPIHISTIADIMWDLIMGYNVSTIASSLDPRYGDTRELFSFISRVYWYDTDNEVIEFIKTQTQFRP